MGAPAGLESRGEVVEDVDRVVGCAGGGWRSFRVRRDMMRSLSMACRSPPRFGRVTDWSVALVEDDLAPGPLYGQGGIGQAQRHREGVWSMAGSPPRRVPKVSSVTRCHAQDHTPHVLGGIG